MSALVEVKPVIVPVVKVPVAAVRVKAPAPIALMLFVANPVIVPVDVVKLLELKPLTKVPLVA